MHSFSNFVGLDIHTRSVSFCVMRQDGSIVQEGRVESTRQALTAWAERVPAGWSGGMEATLCSDWMYWHLKPYAAELGMAHPARLKAISEAKRKNDALDARMLANLLRCDLFPDCYVMPAEYEKLRSLLRTRMFLVRMEVMLKNKMSGMLLQSGIWHDRYRLHGRTYFGELMNNPEVTEILAERKRLMDFGRAELERLKAVDRGIVAELLLRPELKERVARLRAVRGVGEITALTWALETGHPSRFPNERHAVSYCGLCSRQCESAGKQFRTPISKQRNGHLQTMLIEAAHLAVQFNPQLKATYEAYCAKGPRNRATLEVARRLVRRLLAIDREYFASVATGTGTAAA